MEIWFTQRSGGYQKYGSIHKKLIYFQFINMLKAKSSPLTDLEQLCLLLRFLLQMKEQSVLILSTCLTVAAKIEWENTEGKKHGNTEKNTKRIFATQKKPCKQWRYCFTKNKNKKNPKIWAERKNNSYRLKWLKIIYHFFNKCVGSISPLLESLLACACFNQKTSREVTTTVLGLAFKKA